MKFSIIITTHNSENTIKACLDAAFSSFNKDFELIVVDDKSTDKTKEIIQSYPCHLTTLEENKGTASARNIGKESSNGQILVFIDSDVLIKNDGLDVIDKSFSENKDIVAVTGLLSKDCPYKNFFSQHKNLYMHYIFKRCPKFVDFLYGSIIAIKKEYFLPFNEKFRITDDTELGQRYKELNKKILLNQELEVVHLKKFNFKSIIKNDFFVPFWWAKSFISHKGYWDIIKKRRFSHARIEQLATIGLSYFFIYSLFFTEEYKGVNFLIFLIIFSFLNFGFFIFLHKERGGLFLLQSACFTFIDSLILGLGAIAGLFYFMFHPEPGCKTV